MATPLKLHPRIRERHQPRISASALAEYVIATPDKHDDILHDARFVRPPATVPYGDALRTLRSYNIDALRETGQIDSAIGALNAKAASNAFKPSQRDEAARCVEAIELFIRHENAFGARAMPFAECPRLDSLEISGVSVSCQPDLIVGDGFPPNGFKIGCAMIRAQKRPDPAGCKTEKTRSDREFYRREMASYMLVIARMVLASNGCKPEDMDLRKFYVFDVRLGERISMPSDRLSREKRIEGACRQIGRLWDFTEPRPGDLAKEEG